MYAPNEDKPGSFKSIFTTLQKHAKDHVVIGGDFNLTLDTSKDRLNCKFNNKNATAYVQQFMESFNLTDIWRDRNVDERKYTWFKKGNNTGNTSASRLDFFLINMGLACNVVDTKITVGCRTDHSLVELSIENKELKRGAGIWRFNNRLLCDKTFCENMTNNITNCKERLSNTGLNKSEIWEAIKASCAEFSKQYSKKKSNKKKQLLLNLYDLQTTLKHENLNAEANVNCDVMSEISEKITELENEKVQGAMFRSRCTWERYGERNSKYYFALERCNYNNKTAFSMLIKGKICKIKQRY